MAGAWVTGRKMGVGTALNRRSRVWFTITDGILSEVYYPTLDTPDTNSLQYVVVLGGHARKESLDTRHTIRLLDPHALAYEVTNTARDGTYRIVTDYSADPARDALLLHSRFEALRPSATAARIYVLLRPNANGSSSGNSASVRRTGGQIALVTTNPDGTYGPVALALDAKPGLGEASVGFHLAASDPYQELLRSHRLIHHYSSARNGTVTELAAVGLRPGHDVTLALGFGARDRDAVTTAQAALGTSYAPGLAAYIAGWHAYAATLHRPTGLPPDLLEQYYVSALTIKAAEDKTYPGALVASPTVPWGNTQPAGSTTAAGYHLVWARDLYEMASALLAAGDRTTALAALRYLLDRQEGSDGSMPQNTFLNGSPHAMGIQLDQVAYPVILAWQLGLTDRTTYRRHIAPAADYLITFGPSTGQERWEETGGYSPSTIAAEIAALICAAEIAQRNGDRTNATLYRAVGDDWTRHLSAWLVTRTGHLSRHPYYIRIDDNTDPNDGYSLSIANGGGIYDERDVVDAGFLELVRLGIVRPTDPTIENSLTVVDRTIRVQTPYGPGWYRYNHDGYGDTANGSPWTGAGVGRLWPVFTGERGEYDLTIGRRTEAAALLATMHRFAYGAGMIPEQVWDRRDLPPAPGVSTDDETGAAADLSIGFQTGQATGSACPLDWSMAQYVRLAADLSARRVLEQPSVVADHYLRHPLPSGPALTLTAPPANRHHFPLTPPVALRGRVMPGSAVLIVVYHQGSRRIIAAHVARDGAFALTLTLGAADNTLLVVATDNKGDSSLIQRTLVGQP